jgi:hypothetical protein
MTGLGFQLAGLGVAALLLAATPPAVLEPHPPLPVPSWTRVNQPCDGCHNVQGWIPALFAHDRTGFQLKGAHRQASCRSCHTAGYQAALPQVCSGCHRDAHRGEFGQRCEGCHTEENWRSLYAVDAHRRTNFPLVGRHSALPCSECHNNMLDRSFTRTTVTCTPCHQADYNRTVGTAVDHVALGFSNKCQDCHQPYHFTGGRFEAHNACFTVIGGPHGGIECLNCHTSLAGARVTGTCSTNTANCAGCHEHACAKMNPLHARVTGYQCDNRSCYDCHQLRSH